MQQEKSTTELPSGTGTAGTVDREHVARILTTNGDPQAAWKFLHCGESGLGWVGTCVDCGEEVYHPSTCDLRICPSCAYRRSANLVDRLSPEIAKLAKHSPPYIRLKHFVLTTSYSLLDYIDFDPEYNLLDLERLGELSAVMRDLRVKIRLMFQEKFPGLSYMGGLIGSEFGPGGWRLHFHVLALCPFWEQAALQGAWHEWSDGNGRWVWVEAVDDPATAAAKVVQYVVEEVASGATGKTSRREHTASVEAAQRRFGDLGTEAVTAAIHFVLKGTRRVQTFGAFYGLGKEDPEICNCPVCGGTLAWETEAEWSLRVHGGDALFLKRANKFPGHDPPTSGQPAQLSMFGEPVIYI